MKSILKVIPLLVFFCTCHVSSQVVVRRAVVVHPHVYYLPVVVRPVPVVMVAPSPAGYTQVYVQGAPYYYNSGVFYVRVSDYGNYEPVSTPVGACLNEQPAKATLLTIEGKTYYQYQGIVYKKVFVGEKVCCEVVIL